MRNAFFKNLFSAYKTKVEKNNFINFVYELGRFKGLIGFGALIGTVLLYQRFCKGSFYIKDKKDENKNDEFYSIDNSKGSILDMDKLEDFYAKEFKVSVEEKNFQKQTESLKSLGGIYLKKAKQVSESTKIEEKYFYLINYNKAIALYNAAFIRSKNKNDQEEIIKLTKITEYFFLQSIGINDKSKVSTSKSDFQHRNELEEIRNSIIKKLNSINDEYEAKLKETNDYSKLELDKAKKIAELYSSIANSMKSFIKKMLNESQEVLGSAPCDYAIVGLGSLSRGEMTPYSDFEWAIVIQDKGEVQNNKNKEYFRNLTHLFFIKILNLKETILPSMAIESLKGYYDGESFRGLSFDGLMAGACKSPLGERDENGNLIFELIGTVKEFIRYQNEDSTIPKDKHLNIVLRDVTFIDGQDYLIKEYNNELIASYNGEYCSGIKVGQIYALNSLSEDMYNYDPYLGYPLKEKNLYNLKKDLYRLPSTAINNLALFYNIISDASILGYNIWQKIEKLNAKGFINDKAMNNLLVLASIANELRLTAYIKSERGQHEDLVFVPISDLVDRDKIIFNLHINIQKIFKLTDHGTVFRYYYIAIPLQNSIKNFCSKLSSFLSSILITKSPGLISDIESYFKETDFFDISDKNRGIIYLRLKQYFAADEAFEKALYSSPEHTKSSILASKEMALRGIGKIEEANKLASMSTWWSIWEKQFNFPSFIFDSRKTHVNSNLLNYYGFLSIIEEKYDSPSLFSTQTRCQFASNWRSLGNYEHSLSDYVEAIAELEDISISEEANALLMIFINYNIGLDNYSLGNYEDAIISYTNALDLCRTYYSKTPNNIDVAYLLNALGNVLVENEEHSKAIEKYEEAIEIIKENTLSLNLAVTYNNIAIAYQLQENKQEAKEYFLKALYLYVGLVDIGSYRHLYQIFFNCLKIMDHSNFQEIKEVVQLLEVAYNYLSSANTYSAIQEGEDIKNKITASLYSVYFMLLERCDRSNFDELKEYVGLKIKLFELDRSPLIYYNPSIFVDMKDFYFIKAKLDGFLEDTNHDIIKGRELYNTELAGENSLVVKVKYVNCLLFIQKYSEALIHLKNIFTSINHEERLEIYL